MSYLFKYVRHKSILKRMTLQRFLNCMMLCAELKARKPVLTSFPIIARINTYPFCNLKCPPCQRIFRSPDYSRSGVLTLSRYKDVMEKIGKYLLLVVLYDEGEPLLNCELPEIIRYTNSLNISTSVSTNLSMDLSEEYIQRLVISGLDRMTVSMDGMTQEIYGRYRIGGDVNLLKDNLERILSFRKKTGSRLFIELQFIDFGFNAHEMADVRGYASRVGVDCFRALQSSVMGLEDYFAASGMTLSEKEHFKLGCLDLWSIAHIDSDGRLFACDFGEDHGMAALGNIFDEDFRALWNAPFLQTMREAFRSGAIFNGSGICRRCPSTNKALPFLR